MTTVKEIIAKMTEATPEDVAVVEKAYEFSKKAHEGQKAILWRTVFYSSCGHCQNSS